MWSITSSIIHDTHHVVLLVSAVYKCFGSHKTLAHDSSILKTFPSHYLIPFVLLSRTGFTKDLAYIMCISLYAQGMNFFNIEMYILERHLCKENTCMSYIGKLFGK